MTKDEALKLALESLERIDLWLKARYSGIGLVGVELDAITAIKEALALTSTKCEVQPAQEPLAVVSVNQSGAIRIEYTDGSAFDVSKHVGQRLYTYPPPQPTKELVAWMYNDDNELIPLYTTPPQEQQSCDKRPWVGLTDEEIDTTWKKWIGTERANKSYTLAIEATLRIKNT